MAHPFNLEGVMRDIADAVSGVVQKDVSQMEGFSRSQLHALAKQAAWIAQATARNELTEEERDFFLDNLAKMTLNFVKVVKGLGIIMVEKAWNAAVRVLWGAIEGVIGKALPFPG
jgi:hypothetical protein